MGRRAPSLAEEPIDAKKGEVDLDKGLRAAFEDYESDPVVVPHRETVDKFQAVRFVPGSGDGVSKATKVHSSRRRHRAIDSDSGFLQITQFSEPGKIPAVITNSPERAKPLEPGG